MIVFLFFFLCVLCHLVFQSKVFQKLYPAAPKLEKEPSPPGIVEGLAKKVYVKRKASQEGSTTGKITFSSAFLALTKVHILGEKNLYFLIYFFPLILFPFFQNAYIIIHAELLPPYHSCHWSLFLSCLSQEMQERYRVQLILAGGCTRSYLLLQTTRQIQRNPSRSFS